MKLVRYQNPFSYNPVTSYAGLREEMDRLFDVAFPALSSFHRAPVEFPVDLYQDKDTFIVRAELPGFRKEDLRVEVADGVLTVTGYQKTETKAKDKNEAATTEERRVSRSITLPEHLKLDQIAAAYENGVLTIRLPKSEEVKPRQIAIDVK